MSALDTSVLVPALLSWHEHHERCRTRVAGARVPSHVLIETYSVLTRLPAPHRISGQAARQLLDDRFQHRDVLTSPPKLQRSLVNRVTTLGIEGGAVYDALVGLIAKEHREELVTRDGRARRTYDLVGAAYELAD